MFRFYLAIGVSFISFSTFAAQSLQKDRIIISFAKGRELLKKLELSEKGKTTTSDRKETKSVIPAPILEGILEKFNSPDSPVQWRQRDTSEEPGKLNGTFTFYGKSAYFQNDGGIWTKFRLRVRLYLSVDANSGLVQRSKATPDFVFLEIKIKGPSPERPDASLKYRMKLHDQSVLALFRSDPKSKEFSSVLEALKKDALSLGEAPQRVDTVLETIQTLSQWKGNVTGEWVGLGFVKPELITNYVRKSYSFTEKNEVIHKDVEYQLTTDQQVRGITPLILPEDDKIEIQRYFQKDFPGTQVTYPDQATVVEFKEPTEVAQSHFSPIRKHIQDILIDKMELEQLPNFEKNHGKAGALSKIFHQVYLDKLR